MTFNATESCDAMTINNNQQEVEENGDETPEYRDRLRTWLIKKINSNTIPGLLWENEEKTIFRMPWKHAGRQDYSLEEDSKIFMAWAKHSGRYRVGVDKPEPIVWKTRLRCALNKMPDIRELPERSRLDISEPYRVYQFLPPVHKDSQIRRRTQRRRSQPTSPQPTPKYELSPHEQRSVLALTYSNAQNTGFSDPHRFQTQKNGGSIFSTPSAAQNAKSNPWLRPLGYPSADSQFGDKLPTANGHINPFVDYLNARRLENSQCDSNRIFPKTPETANYRQSPITPQYSAFSTQQHTDVALPGQLPTNPSIGSFPPMMMSAAGQGLAAFALRHQLGMSSNPAMLVSHLTAQALALEQKFQEQMNYRNLLEEENEKLRKEEKRMQREIKRLQQVSFKPETIKNSSSEELTQLSQSLNKEREVVCEVLKQRGITVGQEENKFGHESLPGWSAKINELERELKKYQEAHDLERQEREKLEKEREAMKGALVQMGDGLRSLAVHITPAEKKVLEYKYEEFRKMQIENEEKKSNDEKKKGSNSPSVIWNPINSTSQPVQSPSSEERVNHLKRTSPPLDLSSVSPVQTKRQKVESTDSTKSCKEDNTYENEQIDIESHDSSAASHFDRRSHSMTSPCSVSSYNSSVESASSPKSPQQQMIQMFGAGNSTPAFSRYSQSISSNGAIHVS